MDKEPGSPALSTAELIQRLGLDAQFLGPIEQINKDTAACADDPLAQFMIRDLVMQHIRNVLGSRMTSANALIQALPIAAHHASVEGVSMYFNDQVAHVVGVPGTKRAIAIVRQTALSRTLPDHQEKILEALSTASKVQARTNQQIQASHKKARAAVNAIKAILEGFVAGLPLEAVQPEVVAAAPPIIVGEAPQSTQEPTKTEASSA